MRTSTSPPTPSRSTCSTSTRASGSLPDRAAHDALGVLEGEAFQQRLALVRSDLLEALTEVYGARVDPDAFADELVADALAATASRREELAVLDRRREADPSWFLAEEMVGYVCYADRFAGDLAGVADRLDHLAELGVRYLHLMPLLRPREGENDGGYAVADYEAVDPRLGTMADLETLADSAHRRRMALCVDLVLNHTAREHPWARRAVEGEAPYRDFYRFFPDRTEPDAYEATLPEVFPGLAPGSFSPVPEKGEWVWTTFHDYQWDLDWSNPEVFRAMLGVVLSLAGRGVDVLRLDAAPFLWKRLGTDSQNQPEAHRILQALKALVRLARPGVLLKAEAIVGPDQLVPYLGDHEVYRPECDLAYDNQLMVMLWSALASREVRLPLQALGRRRPAPAGTGWVTYLRCHDDIGWAVGDEDAWAVGTDPGAHRRFLASFYAGDHPGSFARGLRFQPDPATGAARTSGMCASMAGLEQALESGNPAAVDAALRRIETLYAIAYSFGGIPLIYMGDEIALLNDRHWAEESGHGTDNRWLHRPRMDWEAAARRKDPDTVEGRCFAALRRLGEVRGATVALRSDAATTVIPLADPQVLAYVRRHPRGRPVLGLARFSDEPASIDLAPVRTATGVRDWRHLHSSAGELSWNEEGPRLPAWGFAWLAG